MDKKILTVVVPVYKVEAYINKCLDSLIIPQDRMERLEVIVVNDGTPDNSAEMAREYEKRFPDVFRIIDKENGGHGSAWNRGLKEAQGKYIRFLDSDDWFDSDGFRRLMEKLESIDADIVFSDYNRFFTTDGSTVLCPIKATECDRVLDVSTFDWSAQNMNITNFWYCTYRTDLLRPLWPLFLEGVSYDDSILFVAPLIQARTVCYVGVPVYYYLFGRPGQSMNDNIIKRKYKDRHKVHMQVFDYFLDHADEVRDEGRIGILTRILRNMLREDFLDLSNASYGERALMAEWCDRCERISRTLTMPQDLADCRHRFKSLPFPVYFWLRRIKKVFNHNRY